MSHNTDQKQGLLDSWEREHAVTVKVLSAFPDNKLDFKPHERSRSAKDLMWTVVYEEKVFVDGVVSGKLDFSSFAPALATKAEILEAFEKIHMEALGKIKNMSIDDLMKTMPYMEGPKAIVDKPRIGVVWSMIMDQVHHRGQMSVYVRMAGGKVPSIYGPSADELW